MITLKLLKWDNCFSYGSDNELNLEENTVTQIVGTNGMGKSSIPLIIEEALYNKNSKGIKKADIPNRYLNQGYRIQLFFSKNTDEYVIDIQRKSNIKVVLTKNGEDISSHTATNTFKTLQDVIGIDFKTFSQLVYQNTNSSLQFLTATDTNRKKFLIDLLQLDLYVQLFELFKEETKKVSSKVAGITSKIETIEKWLEQNKLTNTNILPMMEVLIDTEDYENEQATLTKEIQNISDNNNKISKNNKYLEMLKQINLAEAEKITVTEEVSYDDLQETLGSLSGAVAGSKKLLEKLNKLGDHCPTCEQDVDASFKLRLIQEETEKLEQARKEGNELAEKIREIKSANELYQKKCKIERDWKEIYRSIDQSLPTMVIDKKELEDRLAKVKENLAAAREKISTAAKENERRAEHNTRIKVIQEQTAEFEANLTETQESLKGLDKELSNLEVLKKTFSTNGLVAYKIENLVKELEELTNMYLGELSDGRFTLQFVVSNDKLNVEVTDTGNTVDILALSSGELARVNTATLLAIRKLMSSISKSKINVLFLDEVTNVLDDSGREKLVEVLLNEDLNTYIVSHGWTHPLLDKVEVVKQENVSRLEK